MPKREYWYLLTVHSRALTHRSAAFEPRDRHRELLGAHQGYLRVARLVDWVVAIRRLMYLQSRAYYVRQSILTWLLLAPLLSLTFAMCVVPQEWVKGWVYFDPNRGEVYRSDLGRGRRARGKGNKIERVVERFDPFDDYFDRLRLRLQLREQRLMESWRTRNTVYCPSVRMWDSRMLECDSLIH